ncbi:MAG: hypothetical protein WBB31_13580, partial [Saprospiraceae bacterium]
DNLFGRNSLDKTRAVVAYNRRRMKINLPEYVDGFSIESVDWRDSILYRETKDGVVDLKPGIYLLKSPKYQEEDSIVLESKKQIALQLYYAPVPVPHDPYTPYHASYPSASGKPSDPVMLFDAKNDIDRLNWAWRQGSGPSLDSFGMVIKGFHLMLDGLSAKDEENPNAKPVVDYTLRYYFGDEIKNRKKDVPQKTVLVFKGYSSDDSIFPIMISLLMKDGSAFGGQIELTPTNNEYRLKLKDLKKVRAVLMPRPYPTFLPYYSSAGKSMKLDLNQIESLEISIGPGINEEDWGKVYEMMILSVWLE